jgi:IS30 family transposase
MQPYVHFTLEERIRLQDLLREGKNPTFIARSLNRDRSSVYREIKRNVSAKGSYNHWHATSLYIRRRRKCKRTFVLVKNDSLRDYVTQKLKLFWSPECITARLDQDQSQMHVGFATIYRAVKRGLLPTISAKTHLRRRGKRKYAKRSRFASIKPDHTIYERCDQANNRSRVGDWEGDTVHGKNGCIATLVDRRTRLLCAALSKTHSSDDVATALLKALSDKPVNSLTLDNGSEFAKHREFSEELNTTTYFADPHSPWQRGTNENTNGLLRFFFPKGFDFNSISDSDLDHVVDLLNDRPRKCLGWLSPREAFFSKCCT